MKRYPPIELYIVLSKDEDILTVSKLSSGGEYLEGVDKILWDNSQFE